MDGYQIILIHTPYVITGGSYSTTSDINFNTIITFTTTSDIKFNINVGSITYIVVGGGASSGTVQNGKAQGGKAGSNGIGGLGGVKQGQIQTWKD